MDKTMLKLNFGAGMDGLVIDRDGKFHAIVVTKCQECPSSCQLDSIVRSPALHGGRTAGRLPKDLSSVRTS